MASFVAWWKFQYNGLIREFSLILEKIDISSSRESKNSLQLAKAIRDEYS